MLLHSAEIPMARDFIAGADVSHLSFFENRGVNYKDGDQVRAALAILKQHGLNCVRLRLFTSSESQAQADPYNFGNNLDYTVPLAARVKVARLGLMLNLHYSDSWADPGKQTKPAAWTNLTFIQLEEQTYDYSSNTIAAFKSANAMPDYVQVGNEIIGGFLWPDGRVGGNFDTPVQWSQFGRLLKSAISGIRDAAGTNPPNIMIHIDRGGDWRATQWFFDSLLQQQVEFDLIGQSYYPWWHGNLTALRDCLSNTASRYVKPVVIVETAFPWTNSNYNPNLEISSSTDGQVQFVAALAEILHRTPGGKSAGLCWWGAEYVPLNGYNLAGFHRTSFFDFDANALPVVQAVGQLTAPIRLDVRTQGTNVILRWPLSGAGMSLKSSTNISMTSTWMAVTNVVQTAGGNFNVTTPAVPGTSRFFQLQSD